MDQGQILYAPASRQPGATVEPSTQYIQPQSNRIRTDPSGIEPSPLSPSGPINAVEDPPQMIQEWTPDYVFLRYRKAWETLNSDPTMLLNARTFPWPLMNSPRSLTDIKPETVVVLMLGHSLLEIWSLRQCIEWEMQRFTPEAIETFISPRLESEEEWQLIRSYSQRVCESFNNLLRKLK